MKFRLDKSDVKSAVTRVKQEESNSSPHTEILRKVGAMAKMYFLLSCISPFYARRLLYNQDSVQLLMELADTYGINH